MLLLFSILKSITSVFRKNLNNSDDLFTRRTSYTISSLVFFYVTETKACFFVVCAEN